MLKNLRLTIILCLASLLLVSTAFAEPAVIGAFAARVELTKKNLPEVTKSTEAAAERTIANPLMLVNVPYGEQSSFAEELVNRAGELSNAFPPEERMKLITKSDVTLIAVRSWAGDGGKIRGLIQRWQKNGSRIVLFASRAGMPADIKVDDLIDNGATDGSESQAPVNHITNVLNGHLWTAEYTAALTRHGKYPGVLHSMVMPEATAHNQRLQASNESRRFLGDTTDAIPAGQLGKAYLKRVDEIVAAVRGKKTMDEIDKAADIIAAQLNTGGKVGISSCTHILMQEIFDTRLTAMKPFYCVWHAKEAVPHEVKEGEVLVWFSYIGEKTSLEDYTAAIRASKARAITCFVTDDEDPTNNGADAVAHIEQHWHKPDAELAVPFPPKVMSPVSGIDQGLIYRALEEEVAQRVKR